MPGTLIEMELEDALMIVAATAADPQFPWFATDAERVALQAEARRMVEHAAHEAAYRYLTPARSQPSYLKLVDDHDRKRRREADDARQR